MYMSMCARMILYVDITNDKITLKLIEIRCAYTWIYVCLFVVVFFFFAQVHLNYTL